MGELTMFWIKMLKLTVYLQKNQKMVDRLQSPWYYTGDGLNDKGGNLFGLWFLVILRIFNVKYRLYFASREKFLGIGR